MARNQFFEAVDPFDAYRQVVLQGLYFNISLRLYRSLRK